MNINEFRITELRIGNYLIADIGNVKVESIFGSTYRAYCHSIDEDYLADYKISDLKPIPLTEDILLKCGFGWNGGMYSLSPNCVIDASFSYIGIYNKRIEDDCIYDIPKYLHQLQNLYFALTNEEYKIVDSKFCTSGTLTDSPYTDLANIREHEYVQYQLWTKFFEQPLHVFYNDTVNSTINYKSQIGMQTIFSTFYYDWFASAKTLALAGSARLLKVKTSMSDVIFRRINTKGLVYIKTYGKYYGVIEITRSGNFAEFFLLELY